MNASTKRRQESLFPLGGSSHNTSASCYLADQHSYSDEQLLLAHLIRCLGVLTKEEGSRREQTKGRRKVANLEASRLPEPGYSKMCMFGLFSGKRKRLFFLGSRDLL